MLIQDLPHSGESFQGHRCAAGRGASFAVAGTLSQKAQANVPLHARTSTRREPQEQVWSIHFANLVAIARNGDAEQLADDGDVLALGEA